MFVILLECKHEIGQNERPPVEYVACPNCGGQAKKVISVQEFGNHNANEQDDDNANLGND
jgi:hypothetical protein